MYLSKEEKVWLETNFPALAIDSTVDTLTIEGLIAFDMVYISIPETIILNPGSDLIDHTNRIRDVYEVKIKYPPSNSNSILPEVYELGGRIQCLAKRLSIPEIDLHKQPNEALCLCARQEEIIRMPNGLNIQIFLQELVIPFFYSNSYLERFLKRPWKDYSHGVLGILEYYLDKQNKLTDDLITNTIKALQEDLKLWSTIEFGLKKPNKVRYIRCPCDSQRRFDKCHKEALQGLKLLSINIAH